MFRISIFFPLTLVRSSGIRAHTTTLLTLYIRVFFPFTQVHTGVAPVPGQVRDTPHQPVSAGSVCSPLLTPLDEHALLWLACFVRPRLFAVKARAGRLLMNKDKEG